jgi:hypothetical protein
MKRGFFLVAFALAWPHAAQQQTQPVKDASDEAGFVSIFDGKSLDGWEGDPKFWRVENGALVGEIAPGHEIRENTFLIWRGGAEKGVAGDFELKLEYRISERGNSGINYRSQIVDGKPFVLRGYQFDIDGPLKNSGTTRHTGNNYEEKGRTFMALRGQVARAINGGGRQVIGTLGDYVEMAKAIKGDWNNVHLIARGNTLIHLLNGQVMSVLVDDDEQNRASEGLLAVQVHTGPAMKVEFRNVRMKEAVSPLPIRKIDRSERERAIR